MNLEKIVVSTEVSASNAKVWDCYTQPSHIVHWNFANDDWCCPSAHNDMQVGGTYNARMEAKDGSFGFDFKAIYTEVYPFKSFSYGFDDRNVEVTFTEIDTNKTEVIVTFDPETENSIELQKNGWQAILDNFKKYVEHN